MVLYFFSRIKDQENLDKLHRNRENFPLKQLLEISKIIEPVGHMGVTNKYYFTGLTIICRRRSHEDQGPYSFSLNGGTSFPSGHTSNIFQVTTILSYHVNKLPFSILTYTLDIGISFQRIHLNNNTVLNKHPYS